MTIGVGLLARPLRAVALGVGHAGAEDDIVGLGLLQEREIAPVIGRAVRLVDIVGDRMQHAEAIETGAALEAGPGDLPHPALHPILHHQIVR